MIPKVHPCFEKDGVWDGIWTNHLLFFAQMAPHHLAIRLAAQGLAPAARIVEFWAFASSPAQCQKLCWVPPTRETRGRDGPDDGQFSYIYLYQ